MKRRTWTETYTGIYVAHCHECYRAIAREWCFILDGSHDNGTRCKECHASIEAEQFNEWLSALNSILHDRYLVLASSLYTDSQLREMYDTGESPDVVAGEIAHAMAVEQSLNSAAPIWED